MPLPVGNDILDLHDRSLRKRPNHERLINRICSESEKKLLLSAANPEKMLWMLWAAKETAFKVVSKIYGQPPVFAHKRFITSLKNGKNKNSSRNWQGEVRYEKHLVPIEIFSDEEKVHAISAEVSSDCTLKIKSSKWRHRRAELFLPPGAELLEPFSKVELKSIKTVESAKIRLDCKQALSEILNMPVNEIEIIRDIRKNQKMPPHVLLNGRRCPVDISFSHHGCWFGWVIAVEPGFPG